MELKETGSEEKTAKTAPEKKTGPNHMRAVKGKGDSLYEEVGDLAKYISALTQKVTSAESLMEDAFNDLPRGTDQLSEVGRKTEEATQHILDDTERLIGNHELMSTKLESLKATLFDENLQNAMTIKEDISALGTLLKNSKDVMFNLVGTLSFQDPAGQEIKKVEAMLKALQSRLLKLVIAFGKGKKNPSLSEHEEKQILSQLESPSNKGERLNQELVDSVLKAYGF